MNEKDDDQWLAALAGKSDPQASESTNRQAAVLRQAMLKRRSELESETANVDPSEFARLQKRLEAEGLISRAVATNSGGKAKGFMDWLGRVFPGKNGGVAALPVWSLAVNCALVVVVAVQFMSPSQDSYESDVLRSPQITLLKVDNPETKLIEISNLLDSAKISHVVARKSNGTLILIIQASDEAAFLLHEKRIDANIVDSLIKIEIQKI